MTMLAERIDAVIVVDTHKASHTAAVVTPTVIVIREQPVFGSIPRVGSTSHA